MRNESVVALIKKRTSRYSSKATIASVSNGTTDPYRVWLHVAIGILMLDFMPGLIRPGHKSLERTGIGSFGIGFEFSAAEFSNPHLSKINGSRSY